MKYGYIVTIEGENPFVVECDCHIGLGAILRALDELHKGGQTDTFTYDNGESYRIQYETDAEQQLLFIAIRSRIYT